MRKIILFVVCSFWFVVYAKEIPAKPNPPVLVNDYANVLSADQKIALERKLVTYFDSTSTQIVIIIENSLEGDDLFDYSQRLATAWGIGEKGKNNGLLIYVSIQDRKDQILTGYGMEATITDALSTDIRHNQLGPNFKQGKYFEGLDEATDIIMRAASGEYVNDRVKKKPGGGFSKFILFFIIIIVLMAIFRGRGGMGGGLMGPIFFGTFGSGGFSSGGGGGDSGGFGGFGGGGFGGGGSGGSW
jgi:uncharacterized protein